MEETRRRSADIRPGLAIVALFVGSFAGAQALHWRAHVTVAALVAGAGTVLAFAGAAALFGQARTSRPRLLGLAAVAAVLFTALHVLALD